MKTQDYSFDLPEELIAQHPPAVRGNSRLMVLDRASRRYTHRMVADLPSLLEPGSVVVFNNTKVRKARIIGHAEATGARAEFLLVEPVDAFTWKALVQRSKRRRAGTRWLFDGGAEGRLLDDAKGQGEFRLLRFSAPLGEEWLERFGHIPLPPYIKREDTTGDADRYQTIYAAAYGSAAAPTAGLHVTEELLLGLKNAGLEILFITLHVGLGTFLPVRVEDIEEHSMHREVYSIGEEEARRINAAKAQGRTILAVGTTSLRALESAWDAPTGRLQSGESATSIFIYPGYTFKVVDALFTNFHTPRSTLLMLVSAFAEDLRLKATALASHPSAPGDGALGDWPVGEWGRSLILESYAEAIAQRYRFYSYGDAMLIQ